MGVKVFEKNLETIMAIRTKYFMKVMGWGLKIFKKNLETIMAINTKHFMAVI